jgi:hypothetical protein
MRSCVLVQEATTFNTFYVGLSFQHLAIVLISIFTLCYGPGLLFRASPYIHIYIYVCVCVCVCVIMTNRYYIFNNTSKLICILINHFSIYIHLKATTINMCMTHNLSSLQKVCLPVYYCNIQVFDSGYT